MSHKERWERRERMAEAIRNGASCQEVCLEFNVSRSTVREACIENGVQLLKSVRAVGPNFLTILKDLMDGAATAALVSKFGVCKQRIYQIRDAGIAAGFKLKGRAK